MACYTVQLYSVEFKTKHLDLLFKAIEAMKWTYKASSEYIDIMADGYRITVDLKEQKAESRSQEYINKLKQQYSIEAYKKAASINKWIIRKDMKASNKFQTIKY